MGESIKAISATELTNDQIITTRARAAIAGDDRLVCYCNDAIDQSGDTPARKAVARTVNETRRWLASRLGVSFVEVPS